MTEQASQDGARYGDYDVESFLGKGSIGKVYLARHRRIGRRVALKTVHLEHRFEDDIDEREFYKRLQREAELCGSMQHPNIVTLYDVGYDGEVVSYFATEYIDGESLLARLRRTRPLPLVEAMSIACDVLRGLAYAHAKGIIHRDIKPANILLTSEGQAKIADFGVARPLHSSLTTTRTLVGTPNYMSPEQVRTTPVSPRSDLFSTGVVMYELLTGIKPFASPELSGILYNVVNLVPSPVHEVNPAVPQAVSRVVQKLLAKTPEERYAAAADALADLESGRAPRDVDNTMFGDAETVMIPHADDAGTPLPTLIDEIPGEATPRRRFNRDVPAIAFWLIVLLLVGGLATAVVALRSGISKQKPVAVITPEQVRLDQAKKSELERARALTRDGKFEESLALYDDFLKRHPQSLVARTERDATQKLLDEQTPKTEVEVERTARKTKRESDEPAPEKKEAEKKPGRWERVKRWFRGG
ncbi:MAG TPA: protein kinase [Thermoanaerobaculia bacterium]|nr:protein kinase [Thermoanaerobaculia bacterium]